MNKFFLVGGFFWGLFFTSQFSYSQSFTYELTWTQNQQEIIDGNKIFLLHFNGAHYSYIGSQVPIFISQYRITSEKEAKLTNIQTEIIPEIQLKDIDKNQIPDDFQLKSSIAYERKQPILVVEIIPVRYNSMTKNYERLVQFTVELEDSKRIHSDVFSIKQQPFYILNSALSNGKWKKIKITQTGVYRLTYQQIRDMGFSNPENIKVYGNGGAFLGYSNNQPRIDDLAEIPIYLHKGNDEIFNEGDYILFYARAPIYWRYDATNQAFVHSLHPYTDESYYFLTDYGTEATKLTSLNNDTLTATHTVTSFDDYAFHEVEAINFNKSGRLWVGEAFDYTLTYTFSFSFPNTLSGSDLYIQSEVYTRSSLQSSFTFSVNGSNIGNLSMYGSGSGGATIVGGTFKKRTTNNSSNLSISITYNKPPTGGEAWLDYLLVNVRRELLFSSGQMLFRDAKSVGNNNVAEFKITTNKANAVVWDVTNPVNPFIVEANYANNQLTFKARANEIRDYVIFDGTSFLSPIVIADVPNQNLHALSDIDLVIVSHKNFLSAANEIADIHRNNDNLRTVVLTPEEIYNEFSSGMPDVAAIKFFMKMLYDKAGTDSLKMPKYLLLFGDGSYDNRHYSSSNTNFIISYQSSSSLSATTSLTTDDFFGLLDDTEYEYVGKLDIGVGRIPVKSAAEANNYVKKLKSYYSSQSLGEWRNWISLLADDEDANEHISQANTLAQYLENNFPQYCIDKIYLDAFSQESTPTGDRYPDAKEAVSQRMKKGCLVFNYTGHGNEYALTHEHVIIVSDIVSWSNFYTLPLFITATCEFGRWDDKTRVSAGELVLLNPNGGAITMFTTTRLVYSTSNFALNKSFFESLFPKNANGEYLRLGDAYRIAKNKTGGLGDINKRNFSLLGDPALRIAFPAFSVITDSINSIPVSQFNDTIHPLQKVTIKGHIENNNQLLSDFNGEIIVTVFDKPSYLLTLANDGGSPYPFTMQNDILFRGKASVINGYFQCEFIVPKDIKYTDGFGKISYYASNNVSNADATGSLNTIMFGGEVAPSTDSRGPQIELFMNNENFSDGGITNESPTLIVKLYDESGINTVSSSIGHDITAVLDRNPNNKFILNDNYLSDKDTYQRGTATYSFSNLPAGEHTITVKAWDIVNNSSEKSLRFVVKNSEDITLQRVLNYPNPFTNKTSFYFEHNNPFTNLDVSIQIFSITGKVVKTIQTTIVTDGYRSTAIEWDGRDDFGDKLARGVYFYKIRISDGKKTAEKFEKLVIIG